MKTLILILAATTLAGCGTNAKNLQSVLDAQTKMRPTLSMSCPAGGCSLEYTDPRDRGVKLPTNGYDALVAVSGQVTSLVGSAVMPGVMGYVAVEGFKALKGSGMTMTTTLTDRHDTYDSHDATATPTIVTQPTPLVVTQPDPTIVNPVIVNQPTPVQIPAGEVVIVPGLTTP